MRKKLTLLGVLAFSITAFSQVGIGTETPKSTLDVVALPSNLTAPDGIIAPRLTGAQLKAKDALYTETTTSVAGQTGAIVYVTTPLTAANTSEKTVNVTAKGCYYFDGIVWQKFIPAYVEPWRTISPDAPATANDQNIYQMGKVSIGKKESKGFLSIYDNAGTASSTTIYTEYTKIDDSGKRPWFALRSNLGYGSWSSLSLAGDQAFVFSIDADPTAYSRNGLEFVPHTAAGGKTPFGFKITDQGMFAFNAQFPTETMDLATGTMRIRKLPKNGAENAIYTTPAGNSSLPETVANVDSLVNKTQTFSAIHTVVTDKNGVLGYVDGLPVTKNTAGIVVIENLPVFEDNAAATVPVGGIYRTSAGVLMVKY